jgi:hypothetical protein
MLPDSEHLKRMLASMDVAIASAEKWPPDEDDFLTWTRASVRVLMFETTEANRDWVKGQIEKMLARHGPKDFGL